MNIEKMLREIPEFSKITVDTILFESTYPVLFTCKNNDDVLLMICCTVNSHKIEWIGTRTTYENLIDLLKNKVTIREAFLAVTDEKIIIEKDKGKKIACVYTKEEDIPDYILPTEGEYIDAEEDEYAEEIAKFENELSFQKITLQEVLYSTWYFRMPSYPIGAVLTMEQQVHFGDAISYRIQEISSSKAVSMA